jgi:hypothetical protein
MLADLEEYRRTLFLRSRAIAQIAQAVRAARPLGPTAG